MTYEDKYVAFCYALITLALVGMVLTTIWILINAEQRSIAQEICSPDEFITNFESKGHQFAVCNTRSGLVVREVKQERKEK